MNEQTPHKTDEILINIRGVVKTYENAAGVFSALENDRSITHAEAAYGYGADA